MIEQILSRWIGLCNMMIISHRSSKPKQKPKVEPVAKSEEIIKQPEEKQPDYFIRTFDEIESENE